MLSRSISFIAAFSALACLITAISAAVYEEPYPEDAVSSITDEEPSAPLAETSAPTQAAERENGGFVPRYEAPSVSDSRYYSDDNAFYAASYGMPNCTCYAWGRAYELLGKKPRLCLYDAGCWYDYNRNKGIYACGDVPERGAIACWAYADGGSGHVAVVESIDGDTVTFSNSAYQGETFYLSTAPASDPSNGMENWIFQGYIYVGRAA